MRSERRECSLCLLGLSFTLFSSSLHSMRFNAGELARTQVFDKETVDSLVQDSSHLVELTNDVLDLTKMEETSNSCSTMEPVVLLDLEKSIVRLIDGASRQHAAGFATPPEISVQIDYAGIPEVILIDQPRITQIVLNYVSNAIKYAGDQGPIVVRMSALDKPPKSDCQIGEANHRGQYLVFEVIDVGAGISGDASKLFLPFETGSRQRNFAGRSSLGIGLAVCHLNALRMRGVVGVLKRRRENVFFLAVPLLRGHKEDIASEETLGEIPSPQRFNVLAVDDEQMNLLILSKMLRGFGVNVEIARHADECFRKLEAGQQFDLILMDYQLDGDMTGPRLLNEIRDRSNVVMPRCGAIVMSAHVASEIKEECERSGFVDYLTKPFDKVVLKTLLLRHLCWRNQCGKKKGKK